MFVAQTAVRTWRAVVRPALVALSFGACLGACTPREGPPDDDPATLPDGATPSPDRVAGPAAGGAAAGATRTVVYTCGEYRFVARYVGDSVALTLPAGVVTLPIAVSASGARYAGAGYELWSRGAEARFTTPNASYAACQSAAADTPWEAARMLGVEFRAVGQEPGWALELDEGRQFRFVTQDGAAVTTPVPAPQRDAANGATTYRARTEAHELTVTIAESPCRDAMSNEAYTHTVTVRLDGRDRRGCGRALTPAVGGFTGTTGTMVHTEWRLVEVGGRPAVAGTGGRAATLRLSDDANRVTGSTGCNRLFGGYEITGERVRFLDVGATKMACADAALMQQERALFEALAAADRYAVLADALTLYQGDRVLARFAAG